MVDFDKEENVAEDILQIIKGPDFPTGATILGTRGIEEAYRTGRGKIRVRAVTDIEPMANGKNRIIVTELPFMVNKARLIEKIAELENITVTDEEVEAEYASLAESSGLDVAKIKEQLLKEDVHYHLTLKKALDLLREKAVITEKTPFSLLTRISLLKSENF